MIPKRIIKFMKQYPEKFTFAELIDYGFNGVELNFLLDEKIYYYDQKDDVYVVIKPKKSNRKNNTIFF